MSNDTNYIKALGSLMNNYESDLEYIAGFQKAKRGNYNEDYLDMNQISHLLIPVESSF